MQQEVRIAVSAGELSGDQHLARVVQELKARIPAAKFSGMGGRNLRVAGVETLVDSEEAAGVMGFLEVAEKFTNLLSAFKTLKTLLIEWKPSVLIIVDFPDFNLRLAKIAKSLGIKVLYYIPPKVWVWRKGRIHNLERYTDWIASIFPFEADFLRSAGLQNVSYVGHPFLDDPDFSQEPRYSRREIINRYHLDPALPILLVLPGSRKFEVKKILPVIVDGLIKAREKKPFQVIVAAAPTVELPQLPPESLDWIKVAVEPARELMKISDCGILKSGTCNLEAAFLGLPFVCVYFVTHYQAFIVKKLAGVQKASIVNYIRPDTVTELLQSDFSPKQISEEVAALLEGHETSKLRSSLNEVVSQLKSRPEIDGNTAPERVAAIAQRLLGLIQ